MIPDKADSPPPAYSEREYDQKIADTTLQLCVNRSEDSEDGERQDGTCIEQAASSNSVVSPSPSRALPSIPSISPSSDLRIHKKSASHSFSSRSTKPRPSWLAEVASEVSSPPHVVVQTDLSHRPRRALPLHPQIPSNRTVSASAGSPTAPPHLEFDPAVAYARSELSSMGTETRQSASDFDASAFYNSAVSSHLKSSSPRTARPRHQFSQSVSSFASNYHDSSPASPVPRYSAQPFSEADSSSYDALAAPTSPTRWATTEYQVTHF